MIEFTDNPQYFGSWRMTVEFGQALYQLVSDGRESCLEIQKHDGKEWETLRYTSINALSREQELQICSEWLAQERSAMGARSPEHGT